MSLMLPALLLHLEESDATRRRDGRISGGSRWVTALAFDFQHFGQLFGPRNNRNRRRNKRRNIKMPTTKKRDVPGLNEGRAGGGGGSSAR